MTKGGGQKSLLPTSTCIIVKTNRPSRITHTHIQDRKDQVMKSHAYGLRRSAAVLDRAAVTPVPSSKHRPACRPLLQSSAERARADKGHMAGTLGCGGLT